MAESALTTGPPDYVGVGTQRSGTTWWQRLLKDHPRIRTARDGTKEQHFFDWFGKRPMEDADIARYHERFPRAPGELAGEWTPRYMRDLWTPRLLARAAPQAKLLVMLRDPVERYRSGVLHRIARTPERKATWLATDAVERGRYAVQMRRLLDYFDESQILVMQYERCIAEPLEQYQRTLEFLEVEDHVPTDLTRTRGTPTMQRREPFWEDFKFALARELEPDVAELREILPNLDLDLWPNFQHLARGGNLAPRPRPEAPARRQAPKGGPPDFIGVGSSYSGWGPWADLLFEHPDVRPPRGGVPNLKFFGTFCTRAMTDEDIDAYYGRFPQSAGKVVGEWTPRYMYDIWTPMLLHRVAPDAKLLVMLVDPIVRYETKLAEELERRLDDERMFMSDSVGRGRYTQQLRGLLEYYDRERILVLQFERCVEDPVGQYERMLHFLGVREDFRPAHLRNAPLQRARRVLGRVRRRLPGAPEPARADLWPELEIPLLKELEPDVRELHTLVPDIDLSLWPSFAHLAGADPVPRDAVAARA